MPESAMSDAESFATPEGEEVFQLDEPPRTVPVSVEGVVQTTDVPGRTTGFRSFLLATSPAQRIVDDDPRRATVTILALDDDIRIAGDMGSASSSGGVKIPVGTPVTLGTSDEIWAASTTIPCEVSVISEYWAR
jgi:hypothetical protein